MKTSNNVESWFPHLQLQINHCWKVPSQIKTYGGKKLLSVEVLIKKKFCMYDLLLRVSQTERIFGILLFYETKKYELQKEMLGEKQRRKMRAGQPGPQPAKSAGPTAKLRASGLRARSKSRPVYF